MPIHPSMERVRNCIAEERAIILDLHAKVGDDLKKECDKAMRLLDDLVNLFLSPKVLAEPRNPAQWDYWAGEANRAYTQVVVQREHVEKQVARFGPDARVVP